VLDFRGQLTIGSLLTDKPQHNLAAHKPQGLAIAFSPDGQRVAFGCADKTVRMIAVSDGKELMKFDNHSDWVFGTTFTVDGTRLLTGSRDRAMKLINVANGQFIDDINKLLAAFRALIEAGGSLLVIEHNLDVIKTADYVIDLGAEGGEDREPVESGSIVLPRPAADALRAAAVRSRAAPHGNDRARPRTVARARGEGAGRFLGADPSGGIGVFRIEQRAVPDLIEHGIHNLFVPLGGDRGEADGAESDRDGSDFIGAGLLFADRMRSEDAERIPMISIDYRFNFFVSHENL
jgi:hypothetical protein